MKQVFLVIALLALVPLAAVTVLPVARYARSDREVLPMDDAARRGVPGSFARLSAGTTHYQLGGPEGGTTLVLIPGFSTPYNVWDPTYDGLTRAGVRVLRYELFGRGYSDRPAAGYDADFFDRQLLDLLDSLGLRAPVDVAGVSMGGPIAATFAVRHPERVRKVLLFDPGYWTERPLPFGLRTPLIGEYNMAVSVSPDLAESQFDDFLHPERYPHYIEPYREQMRYRGFRRALLATLRNYISKDVTPDFQRLGKSGKPVLLIWGAEDKDTPIELSKQVLAAVPQAQFHPIDDAAHLPHYEHPEVVNPIVLKFLK